MNQIESMPLTVGIAIAVIAGVGFIVGLVWTIATIRANDKADITKDITEAKDSAQNALNRLEKKTDQNHDILHSRVNKQMEEDGKIQYQLGYLTASQEYQSKITLKLLDKLVD